MTIVLFTITDVCSGRGRDFDRMMASVADQSAPVPEIRHYVLLQNCDAATLRAYTMRAPATCRMTAVADRLSVSAARNLLFAHAMADGVFRESDVLGFPDDDCWMPDGFLRRLADVFEERRDLGLLACRSDLEPDGADFDARSLERASVPALVRQSSSNTMFVRGCVAARVGHFDPELGLGTPAGGGEDTDYVIRASLQSREAGFIDRALVGHRPSDRASAARYFRGAFIVLAQHARRSPALRREFLRKVLVGGYFILRGRLAPTVYGQALLDGARALRSPPRQRALAS